MLDHFDYKNNRLHCDGVAVDDIAAEAGTPVYIYSRAMLEERYRELADAFSGVETTVCFSVKCCSSLGVLSVLRQCGSGFDVVSGGELFRVIRAGGDPLRAVFAGVGKTDMEIRYALEQGLLMFNVESEEELAAIDHVAKRLGKTAPVALRLNPDVDPKTHRHTTTGKKENKFGIDLERAGRLVANLANYPGIALKGLHVHIGSPVNSTQPYADALDKVLDFLDANKAECGDVEYINCGGGFGLVYKDESVPPFVDYAAVIVPRVKQAGKKLILEPGRSIAGNAGILVGEVQYVKSNGEKFFVILDTAMNDLIRPAFYEAYHLIWPTATAVPPLRASTSRSVNSKTPTAELMHADIVGPVCESSDCFAKDRAIPMVKRGEKLALFSAGAYGFTMASTYNSRPRPAEVLVEGDAWRVIRRRETWDDLVALESE